MTEDRELNKGVFALVFIFTAFLAALASIGVAIWLGDDWWHNTKVFTTGKEAKECAYRTAALYGPPALEICAIPVDPIKHPLTETSDDHN